MKYLTIPIIFFASLVAAAAQGATLTAEPRIGASGTDVILSINTEGETVNAVELHATFDSRIMRIAGIDDGGSVMGIWIDRPSFSNEAGTLDFTGIIPGGINTADGVVATLHLASTSSGALSLLSLVSGRALLNDGKGTPASFSLQNASTAPAALPAPQKDLQAPDPFLPQVGRDPTLYDGKYFLAFSATDNGSGVDHYEVLEVPHSVKGGEIGPWQRAESPYLLRDQSLSSDIYVRAVDRAGNFRTVTVPPSTSMPPISPKAAAGFPALAFGILLMTGIGLLLWRRTHNMP